MFIFVYGNVKHIENFNKTNFISFYFYFLYNFEI